MSDRVCPRCQSTCTFLGLYAMKKCTKVHFLALIYLRTCPHTLDAATVDMVDLKHGPEATKCAGSRSEKLCEHADYAWAPADSDRDL